VHIGTYMGEMQFSTHYSSPIDFMKNFNTDM